jgi:hypothetical protein
MPDGADGQHYRSHSQAARYGAKKEDKPVDNGAGGNEVGKGKNIVAIKHSGRDEDGARPPFHVMHEDGTKHGPMNSHEELMDHLHEHMGGGEFPKEEQPDSDYGSEGSEEAIKTLLG